MNIEPITLPILNDNNIFNLLPITCLLLLLYCMVNVAI